MTIETCIISDLDNCLADDSWRVKLIRWDTEDLDLRWHEYHIAAANDPPPHNLHLLEEARRREHDIVIFTARPLLYRKETERWLSRHGVPHDALIMRNNNDKRPSVAIKRSMLACLHMYGYEQIAAAYDDHPEIVEMYLSCGIKATRVEIHPFAIYARPE